jgi:hypothetical protein
MYSRCFEVHYKVSRCCTSFFDLIANKNISGKCPNFEAGTNLCTAVSLDELNSSCASLLLTTTGLADFFQQGCQIFLGPKYQNGEKYTRLPQNTYTKWPWNISNARKTDQMVIKYTKIFHSKTLKIYSNWDFWFENKPSGNPVFQSEKKLFLFCFCLQSALQER